MDENSDGPPSKEQCIQEKPLSPSPSSSTKVKENCDTAATPSKECASSWVPEAGWAVSWVNSAKEKTKSTFELIKKDISEFSDTLQNETNSLVNSAAKKAQLIGQIIAPIPDETQKKEKGEERTDGDPSLEEHKRQSPSATEASQQGGFFGLNWMKQMASEVVETVHKFATEDTTSDEANITEEIRISGGHGGGRRTKLDQCTLLQMQNDRRTFLQKPQRGVEFFDVWLNDFKIAEYNGEINLLLGENSRLRELYAELVPAFVDNHTFWHRYFFKVHVKEMEKQAQDELSKLNVDNKNNSPEGHSPDPSNGARDDWSMCSSSGITTEAEESESDAIASRNGREDASTPRPEKNGEAEVDDWEECEGEANSETKTANKTNETGQ